VELDRISNSTSGTPRYVTHFLNLLTETDLECPDVLDSILGVCRRLDNLYLVAVNSARSIFGSNCRAYQGKGFGGGVVIYSYAEQYRIEERIATQLKDWNILQQAELNSLVLCYMNESSLYEERKALVRDGRAVELHESVRQYAQKLLNRELAGSHITDYSVVATATAGIIEQTQAHLAEC
jgi:hypothetical protein